MRISTSVPSRLEERIEPSFLHNDQLMTFYVFRGWSLRRVVRERCTIFRKTTIDPHIDSVKQIAFVDDQ